MTKDEVDEWMRQRGFAPLENVRSPKAPGRISPEEWERFLLWGKKRTKVLAEIIVNVRANRITTEEGRRRFYESRKRDSEEFGISPANSTDE